MVGEDSEVVTILVGAAGSQATAQQIVAMIGEQYPDLECEIHEGDQPVYPYLIAVE